jgi:hypothetical protein
MGAKNIAYVGVEQEDAAHFYDYNEPVKRLIASDIEILREHDEVVRDHGYSSYEWLKELLAASRADLEAKPFPERHQNVFEEYFRQLSALGINVYSASPSGVTLAAGAVYLPVEECFAL